MGRGKRMSKRERLIWQFIEAACHAACLIPIVAGALALYAA